MRVTKLIFTGLLLAPVAFPTLAAAAEISLMLPESIGAGDTFEVQVSLATRGQSINALEGTLRYPRDLLELTEIRDGNSLINLWLERPHDAGGIRFAGVTPGGFTGTGEIFRLVFLARSAGERAFTLEAANALLNDGSGSATAVTFPPIKISIGGRGEKIVTPLEDRTTPDEFTPIIGSDPALFEGRTFVVFATQDKASGIAGYEIAESAGFQWFGFGRKNWTVARSPHELADQTGFSHVYIKAIDKAGNERVAVVSPQHAPFYYRDSFYLAILILFILLGGIYARTLFTRFR